MQRASSRRPAAPPRWGRPYASRRMSPRRASDAERDQVAERLGEACAHGRVNRGFASGWPKLGRQSGDRAGADDPRAVARRSWVHPRLGHRSAGRLRAGATSGVDDPRGGLRLPVRAPGADAHAPQPHRGCVHGRGWPHRDYRLRVDAARSAAPARRARGLTPPGVHLVRTSTSAAAGVRSGGPAAGVPGASSRPRRRQPARRAPRRCGRRCGRGSSGRARSRPPCRRTRSIAASSISTEWMSRWLVGSSSTRQLAPARIRSSELEPACARRRTARDRLAHLLVAEQEPQQRAPRPAPRCTAAAAASASTRRVGRAAPARAPGRSTPIAMDGPAQRSPCVGSSRRPEASPARSCRRRWRPITPTPLAAEDRQVDVRAARARRRRPTRRAAQLRRPACRRARRCAAAAPSCAARSTGRSTLSMLSIRRCLFRARLVCGARRHDAGPLLVAADGLLQPLDLLLLRHLQLLLAVPAPARGRRRRRSSCRATSARGRASSSAIALTVSSSR